MNPSVVWTLLRHELRMVYRDRRTVLLSVVLPVALMPVLLVAFQAVQHQRRSAYSGMTYTYAVIGSRRDRLRDLLATQKMRHLRELVVHAPLAALRRGKLDLVVAALGPPARKRHRARRRRSLVPPTLAARQPGVPVVRLSFRADRDRSLRAHTAMEKVLNRVLRQKIDARLRAAGSALTCRNALQLKTRDIAGPARVTGALVGPYVTGVLVLLLLGGGSVAAMDILAGEKERGSLETLLTTAAGRREIVAAKQLAVLVVAVVIALIQVANLLIYVTFRLVSLPSSFDLWIPPAGLLALGLCFVPLAALLAAVLLAISGRSSSYKEAQLLYFPVFVVCVALGMAGLLPQTSLRSAIVALPLANLAVAVREVFSGLYDWPLLATTALVNLAAAAGLVLYTARSLTAESVLAGPGPSDSESRFSRAVAGWFAVMAAALVVVPPNIAALSGLTGQVVFNELVVFVGVSLLMVRYYRLDLRKVFALRRVRWPVWLAVLILVPTCQVAAVGLVKLTDLLLPVPTHMLEKMSEMMVPAGWSLPHLILLIGVVPGICEELAFRGVLLYGLHRRLRPVWLALVVGATFGAFHFSLFRVLPTGFIGTLLAGMALLTGSIFPGMVLHIGNNVLAVCAYREHIALSAMPAWVYLVAVLAQVVAFGILYRVRTPYPGLLRPKARPSRRGR